MMQYKDMPKWARLAFPVSCVMSGAGFDRHTPGDGKREYYECHGCGFQTLAMGVAVPDSDQREEWK